jgi:mannose-6-phosphate isomerase-like protein (cupin superfamily)
MNHKKDNDQKKQPCTDYNMYHINEKPCISLKDHGPKPYVVNIQEAANQNYNFRLALWTGTYLQLTLMTIFAGDDIGLEMHPDVDQFLRIEEGQGIIMMGNNRKNLGYKRKVYPGDVVFIPAGTWHNLTNTGCTPIKLYSIYAPPEHPHGTIHKDKEDDPHYSVY